MDKKRKNSRIIAIIFAVILVLVVIILLFNNINKSNIEDNIETNAILVPEDKPDENPSSTTIITPDN